MVLSTHMTARGDFVIQRGAKRLAVIGVEEQPDGIVEIQIDTPDAADRFAVYVNEHAVFDGNPGDHSAQESR